MKGFCIKCSLFCVLIMCMITPSIANAEKQKGVLTRAWQDSKAQRLKQLEVGTGQQNVTEEKEVKEFPPKEQMVETIRRRLTSFPSILEETPGLFKRELSGGIVYYYTIPDGGVQTLGDLDETTLHSLYIRINRRATILNVERITRQLEQINSFGGGVAPVAPVQPVRPPAPPTQVQVPSQIPRPPAPPQQTQLPQAPPRPPALPPQTPTTPSTRR